MKPFIVTYAIMLRTLKLTFSYNNQVCRVCIPVFTKASKLRRQLSSAISSDGSRHYDIFSLYSALALQLACMHPAQYGARTRSICVQFARLTYKGHNLVQEPHITIVIHDFNATKNIALWRCYGIVIHSNPISALKSLGKINLYLPLSTQVDT